MKLIGRNLKIYKIIDGSEHIIASSTSCSIDITSDFIETSTPDMGRFKAFEPSFISWTVSLNWLVTSDTALRQNILSVGDTYRLKGLFDNNTIFEGTAIVAKAKVTANKSNLIQGSFEFKGTGPLE